MRNVKLKPVALAVGTAFAASLAGGALAGVQDDPFALMELEAGYNLLADEHAGGSDGKDEEGSCGEGSCGEGSCGEGSGGDDAKDGEAGGEGSCGATA